MFAAGIFVTSYDKTSAHFCFCVMDCLSWDMLPYVFRDFRFTCTVYTNAQNKVLHFTLGLFNSVKTSRKSVLNKISH